MTTQSQALQHAVTTKPLSQRRYQRWLPHLSFYTVLIAVTLICMIPLCWLLLSSLKLNSEYNAWPVRIFPQRPVWENYYEAITIVPFFALALRSLLLSLLNTVPIVITSSMVGFGFARHHAPGRSLLFTILLSMVMVPGLVTTIPTFVLYTRLGLINTYWPWLLWGLSGSPFYIFLFRQYFANMPKELEDAAEIDGANRFRIYWQIFMPNAGPVIVACSIFAFSGVWGDFFTPLLFLKESQLTLAAKLATAYVDPKGQPLVTQTMAAIVLFILPLILVYFVGQKQIQQSTVTSGIKL